MKTSVTLCSMVLLASAAATSALAKPPDHANRGDGQCKRPTQCVGDNNGGSAGISAGTSAGTSTGYPDGREVRDGRGERDNPYGDGNANRERDGVRGPK